MARRSDRDREPVLIWPELVATAISAIVLSSVSPDRCDITAVKFPDHASTDTSKPQIFYAFYQYMFWDSSTWAENRAATGG